MNGVTLTLRVTICLMAMGQYPDGFDESGNKEASVPEGTTITDIIGSLPAITGAHLINGTPVPPEARDTHLLKEGDELTLFPPIHGG